MMVTHEIPSSFIKKMSPCGMYYIFSHIFILYYYNQGHFAAKASTFTYYLYSYKLTCAVMLKLHVING